MYRKSNIWLAVAIVCGVIIFVASTSGKMHFWFRGEEGTSLSLNDTEKEFVISGTVGDSYNALHDRIGQIRAWREEIEAHLEALEQSIAGTEAFLLMLLDSGLIDAYEVDEFRRSTTVETTRNELHRLEETIFQLRKDVDEQIDLLAESIEIISAQQVQFLSEQDVMSGHLERIEEELARLESWLFALDEEFVHLPMVSGYVAFEELEVFRIGVLTLIERLEDILKDVESSGTEEFLLAVADLANRVETLENQNDELNMSVSEMQSTLGDFNDVVKTQRGHEERLRDLEELLFSAELDQTSENLDSLIEGLQNDLLLLSSRNTLLEERLDRLSESVIDFWKDIGGHIPAEIAMVLEQGVEDIYSLDTRTLVLEQEVGELFLANRELGRRFDHAENNVADRFAELNGQVEVMMEDLEHQKQELAVLSENSLRLAELLEVLESSRDKERESWEARMEGLSSLANELRHHTEQLRENVSSLELGVRTLSESLSTSMQQSEQRLAEKVAEYDYRLGDLEETLYALVSDFEHRTQTESMDLFNTQINQLFASLNAVQNDIVRLSLDNAALHRVIQEQAKTIELLRHEVYTLQRVIE